MTFPSTPRGRPRVVTDDRVLAMALAAFARDGYEGVSLRALNRELGMSPAMIAKRFGTKAQLWEAAVGAAIELHRAAITSDLAARATGAPSADPLEPLRWLVVAFIRGAESVPDLHRIITDEGGRATPRLDVIVARVITPLVTEVVQPILTPLVDAGLVRPVEQREMFFLVASGAASAAALGALNAAFDAIDGPSDLATYAQRVADMMVRAIAL